MKRCLALALFVLTCVAPLAGQTQTQPPPKPAAQDEFVPVDKPMNAQDTIPAPRLVAIAYGFIWVVLLGYVWSVRSRLASVEREMQTVSKRIEGGRRA
jgi:CcmD family protein